MDPTKRLPLAALGALIGAILAGPGFHMFGLVLGGFAGLAISEWTRLRARLAAVDAELARLRVELARVSERGAPAPLAPPTTVAPPPATNVAPPESIPPADSVPAPDSVPPFTAVDVPTVAVAPKRPDPEVADSPVSAAVRRFVTGGNTLVRAGVVVLFFGVAFLLRYMAEHTRVPIELRLTGIALGSLALLGVGWRLRTRRLGYALALQGGGVGILYLTVFAALRLYAILPATAAFPLLCLIAAASAMLAVLQDTMSFALLAVAGGFMAPILASTGQGSHVVLFSYYAVLNAGILVLAWYRAWRPLNIAGFLFTFAIGTGWGVLRYRPEDFASTEPFLVLFFLFYLGIGILFALRQPATLRQPAALAGYVDGTVVFGTPIVVLALQSSMLHGRPMALAYSAVALGAVYLLCAWALRRLRGASPGLLVEAFVALGIAFLTLAVPLALDARWNAAAWSLEGAALVWVGCRQSRLLPRIAGVLLCVASGFITAHEIDLTAGRAVLPLPAYFGVLLQTAAAIFSARTLHLHRERLREFERAVPDLLFSWGLLGWVIGALSEISQYLPAHVAAESSVFATATALLASEVSRRTGLAAARLAALLQLPVMLIFALHAVDTVQHPGASGGWLSWPLAFAGLYIVNFRHEGPAGAPLADLLNAGSLWLLLALVSWEGAWAIRVVLAGEDAWATSMWVVFPALASFALPWLVTRIAWPFAKHRDAYVVVAGRGIALYLAAWSLLTNITSTGASAPLPYLPLLNPLDLAQALVLMVLYRRLRLVRAAGSGRLRGEERVSLPVLAALAFIWLNGMLLRTLHQWFAVPFEADALLQSTLVQTSLSIAWAMLALVTMLVAAHRRQRVARLAGASLLGVVVVKLFVIDLSRIGSIERIVSFVGVGVLMLVVGYFSPIPPAAKAAQ